MFRTKFVEKTKHIFHVQELLLENRDISEIMWKNMVDPDRSQTKIWRMRIVCWIPKTANTYTQNR